MRLLSIMVLLFAPLLSCANLSSPKQDEKNMNAPIVTIKTNLGEIALKLNPEKAPETVKNFISYAQSGHYNGTIFHRVIDGFMVQGGGFTSDLAQKPTQKQIKNEANNQLKNKKGTVAMARTSEIHSATSQFFINLSDNEFLNFRDATPSGFGYCVFGEVISGMDVVEKIRLAKTTTKGPMQNVPIDNIVILEVTVNQPAQ